MQEAIIEIPKIDLSQEEVIENPGIDLSPEELCSIVSTKTKVDEKEVKLVLDSFVDIFLKRFKLN